MKNQISAVELFFLIKELKQLEGAKVDKIYQPHPTDFYFQFHLGGTGQKILRIALPGIIYLATVKESSDTPPPFCVFLRKYLNQARLVSITQLGSERIIDLCFQSHEKTYHLFVELFASGNIIFCEEGIIRVALLTKKLNTGLIRPGERYVPDMQEINTFTLPKEQFLNAFEYDSSDSLRVVSSLLGFGSSLGAEFLERSGLAGQKNLSSSVLASLYETINTFLAQNPKGYAYAKQDQIIEVSPTSLQKYKAYDCTEFDSFSEAIELMCLAKMNTSKMTHKEKRFGVELQKVQNIIDLQRDHLIKIEHDIEQNTLIAQTLYLHFGDLDKILSGVKAAKKTYSWADIKKHLKGHEIVRELDEKNGTMTVELNA